MNKMQYVKKQWSKKKLGNIEPYTSLNTCFLILAFCIPHKNEPFIEMCRNHFNRLIIICITTVTLQIPWQSVAKPRVFPYGMKINGSQLMKSVVSRNQITNQCLFFVKVHFIKQKQQGSAYCFQPVLPTKHQK